MIISFQSSVLKNPTNAFIFVLISKDGNEISCQKCKGISIALGTVCGQAGHIGSLICTVLRKNNNIHYFRPTHPFVLLLETTEVAHFSLSRARTLSCLQYVL